MNNQQFVGLVTQVATNAALSVINKAGIIDLRIRAVSDQLQSIKQRLVL